MPSKDFLYLASSLFRGIFPLFIHAMHKLTEYTFHNCSGESPLIYFIIQISMYTIFSCDASICVIYFEKRKNIYRRKTNDFRNVSVDILIMSALFYGNGKGGVYYE